MPVKIRHIQLNKIEWVVWDNYFHNYKNNNLYQILEFKDIYELYNRKSGTELWQTTLEKDAAIEALKKHPDIFRIELSKLNGKTEKGIVNRLLAKYEANQGLSRYDIGNLRPLKKPIIYDTKSKINQIINKYNNNALVIDIVSGLITAFIIWVLGQIFSFNYGDIFKFIYNHIKSIVP